MIGTIRRVVVALDAVSENRAAIDAAARLAASNFARFSASRPKPFVTAMPWMLSARYCTSFSTSVRFCA